jgi:hypothetical protein
MSPSDHYWTRSRGLADAASDDVTTQGYLAQFQSMWPAVRAHLDDLLGLPYLIQAARQDLTNARETAMDAGLSDVVADAESTFTDVQSHETAAQTLANQIAQYRDTWNQIATYVGNAWDAITGAVETGWVAVKRAMGLNAIFLPLALLAAAIAALVIVYQGLPLLSWWTATKAKIDDIKARSTPLVAGVLAGVQAIPQVLLYGGLALGGLFMLNLLTGRR